MVERDGNVLWNLSIFSIFDPMMCWVSDPLIQDPCSCIFRVSGLSCFLGRNLGNEAGIFHTVGLPALSARGLMHQRVVSAFFNILPVLFSKKQIGDVSVFTTPMRNIKNALSIASRASVKVGWDQLFSWFLKIFGHPGPIYFIIPVKSNAC